MEFNDLIPELLVSNITNSEDFYVNKLGFNVEFRREGFLFLSFNGTQLMLSELCPDSWVNGDMIAPFGRGLNLAYKVDLAWIKALHLDDSSLFLPLQTECYKTGDNKTEVNQVIYKDPDGYLLRFISQEVN